MSIYKKTTRHGDKGETILANGRVLKKDDAIVEFMGALDELNAAIAVARTFTKVWPEKQSRQQTANLAGILKQIQHELFHMNALVAGEKVPEMPLKQKTAYWEVVIDGMDIQLEPLKKHILPGGSRVSTLLHMSRATCRKAERIATTLSNQEGLEMYYDMLQYLNRLSDLLFILARLVNKLRNAQEMVWQYGEVSIDLSDATIQEEELEIIRRDEKE